MTNQNFEQVYQSVWTTQPDHQLIQHFSVGYKQFLDQCKTERETAAQVVAMAQAAGFRDLDALYQAGGSLKPGDKVYALRRGRAAALFVVGSKPITQGLHMIAAHVDAPRLDGRPNPIQEKDGVVYLKTHYYGGVKKYQWATLPLALHGVIVKKGGEKVTVAIGESEADPVFYISDLPKHLSADQVKKPMADGIDGEHLNVICGSIPVGEDSRVKQGVLALLHQRYGITETDLVSAELELVPAGKARDVGFDSGMIAAYGHDDRICAYTALQAILETEQPAYTTCVLFADKEEVGSSTGQGMNSRFMENVTARVVELMGEKSHTALRLALENAKLLSADVTVGFDPSYPEAYESNNATHLGRGPVLLKYSGSMGKKGTNDASAELMAYVRALLDDNGVTWQAGEFGKIDQGGGGTIAPFAAAYGMQVLDLGIALLSMHAPYELASKADVYETYRAYKAFLNTDADLEKYF